MTMFVRKALLAVGADARQGRNICIRLRRHATDQAVARDPTFLLAYCKLAHTSTKSSITRGLTTPPSRRAQADEAVRKALELGPDRGNRISRPCGSIITVISITIALDRSLR